MEVMLNYLAELKIELKQELMVVRVSFINFKIPLMLEFIRGLKISE
jgi:hypothetical protein